MDAGTGALAGAVSGGILGIGGALIQNAANRDAAQNQMNFQERMSGSAHVREVADLKAAGLNPILSANAGASSPQGASFNAVNPLSDAADKIAAGARDKEALNQAGEKLKSDVALNAVNSHLASQKIITEQQNARGAAAEAERSEVQRDVDKAAQPMRMKLAPANEILNTVGKAVGAAANATEGGAALKYIMKGLGGPKAGPGEGITKDGSKFKLDTGEVIK